MYDILKGWVATHLSDEESLLLALVIALLAGIILTMGAILAPLLISVVLAYVLQGIVNRLRRYRVPTWLAITVTYVLFLGGFIAFLFFIIPRVWRQLRALYGELPAMVTQVQTMISQLPSEYPEFVSQRQVESWVEMLNAEAGDIGQWVLSVSLSQLPIMVTVIVYMMLVPVFVFFMLKDKDTLIGWLLGFLPTERPLMNRIGNEMNVQMENYVRGKFVEFLLIGAATYILFAAFGVNYAALLAFLVGLSVIIPYVGLIAVTIPVVLIAYMQFGWGVTLLYVLAGYSVIQTIDGVFLVPLLFSEANNLHPLAIIVAVLVFGSWWGVWGVFFAIPLATLVKAVMTAWPSARGNRQAGGAIL